MPLLRMTLRCWWLLIGWGRRRCLGGFLSHLIGNGRLLRDCVNSFRTDNMHQNGLPVPYHWYWTWWFPPLGMRHSWGIFWPVSFYFWLGGSIQRRWPLILGELCCIFLLRRKGRCLLFSWQMFYPPLKVGGGIVSGLDILCLYSMIRGGIRIGLIL